MPTMMNAVAGIAAALFHMAVGVASAQNYRVSTVVGGTLPLGPMPALEVSVGHVGGVATDRADNVYFGSLRGCVFKLDSRGSLLRVAGTCRTGFSGDGGPATNAQLGWPQGLAIDLNGNLYIADDSDCRIRRVAAEGVITTIAGNGACYTSGDGGPARNATLNYPAAVAVDPSGALYVAESNRVRKISPGGTITTFATAPRSLSGVAVDAVGRLYIAAGSQVFTVTASGAIVVVAGKLDTLDDSGDGGRALSASFGLFIGLAIDSAGNLIVADTRVRKVSPNGTVNTIAGPGCCDVGNVFLSGATGSVAVDSSGNVYVTIAFGDVLRKVTSTLVTTVAGTDHPTYVGDGGPAIAAQLSTPQGVAVDTSGNLYIADYGNSRIREVSTDGVITTIAGNGTSGFSGDGGLATSAQLAGPASLAVSSKGELFISEYLNNRVRKVSPDGVISTFAGTARCCDLGDGGPAIEAIVPMPHGIALDSAENVYVAEWPDSRIRKVTPGGIISTVSGTGTRGFSGDGGPAIEAQLNDPWGVAVDGYGNIYVADNQNLRIRKISPDGIITTIAGGEVSPGFNIYNPEGITVDSAGNVFSSGGWKISASGKISLLNTYSGDGHQVFVSGVGITVDSHGNLFLVSGNQILKLEPIASPVSIDGITNGASGLAGAVAPGEIVVVYVQGFGPQEITTFEPDSTRVATTLAGTRVLFNGIAAPVIYTSASQICTVVPYDVGSTAVLVPADATASSVPNASSAVVQVEYQGQLSDLFLVALGVSSPGVFTLTANGRGPAVAYNEDGSLNIAASPAHPGSVITFYATGEGQTSPSGIDGQLGLAPLPRPVAEVNVTIGGKPAAIRYGGGVLGQVAGLLQIKAVVPEGVPLDSSVPLILTVGNGSSQTGVTVAVTGN